MLNAELVRPKRTFILPRISIEKLHQELFQLLTRTTSGAGGGRMAAA